MLCRCLRGIESSASCRFVRRARDHVLSMDFLIGILDPLNLYIQPYCSGTVQLIVKDLQITRGYNVEE